MKRFLYKAFGISIESEFELPELSVIKTATPELIIKVGQIPKHINKPDKAGAWFELSSMDFILNFENIGSFRAQNGNMITVNPNGTIDRDVRVFVLGTLMGIILLQRGMLPFHGSSFLTKNGAILVLGPSGSGKSTLAATMLSKGYPVLCDDISVVVPDHKNNFVLHSGTQHLKLWKDVLNHFGIENTFEKVRTSIEKYHMPYSVRGPEGPFPLKSTLLLTTSNHNEFRYEKIIGGQKFNLLKSQIYRSQFFDLIGDPVKNFKTLSFFATSIDLFKIERPLAPMLTDELAAFIESYILF